VLQFGIPAAAAAIVGAGLLVFLANVPAITDYRVAGSLYEISPVKLVVGFLIVFFAVLELTPRFAKLAFPRRYLFVGGLLSGFFGGLTGNQGAFRTAFLIKSGLDKDAFVGTSVLVSAVVDIVRLVMYGASIFGENFGAMPAAVWPIVAAACLAACLGAILGARLLDNMTLHTVRLIVATLMVAVGFALAVGVV
jgi:uncharacterized membrane protein YfcA